MSTSLKITVEQFDAMVERGDFEPREHHRVELLRGEIVAIDREGPMSPINPPHDNAVDELNDWSAELPIRRAIRVRVQGTIHLPGLESLLQPDLAWLARRDYSRTRPTPVDILLLIEVADSSLARDRGEKAKCYAEAELPDYWIVNLNDRTVEVRRDPVGSRYRSLTIYRAGDLVRPLAFPEVALPVSRLFPD